MAETGSRIMAFCRKAAETEPTIDDMIKAAHALIGEDQSLRRQIYLTGLRAYCLSARNEIRNFVTSPPPPPSNKPQAAFATGLARFIERSAYDYPLSVTGKSLGDASMDDINNEIDYHVRKKGQTEAKLMRFREIRRRMRLSNAHCVRDALTAKDLKFIMEMNNDEG